MPRIESALVPPTDTATTSPRRTRTVLRRGAAVLGVIGATLGLAACQQPLPDITVQSGSFSTTVKPSTYCFDATQCRNNSLGHFDIPVVNIKPNATVLIDVPRVVSGAWQVQALGGVNSATLLGSSGPIRSDHSYRLVGNANGGRDFIVAVSKLVNGQPDDSRWSFIVRTVNTSS